MITDVVMPDENGLDLVPQIRKLRPELKVIVMSAQSTLLTAVKANERGAYEYLPAVRSYELLAVVDRALRDTSEAPRLTGRYNGASTADRPFTARRAYTGFLRV